MLNNFLIKRFKLKSEKASGFTLIEMIVVIGILGLIMPVIFTVIFGIVREQIKIFRLSQIKEEGDFVLNTIGNTIRGNVVSIHDSSPPDDTNQICDVVGASTPTTLLYFLDKSSNWLGYGLSNNQVASYSASFASPPMNLTSSKTIISNFKISCQKLAVYSGATIILSFDICYNTGANSCDSSRPEETATLHYQTRIKLRNF